MLGTKRPARSTLEPESTSPSHSKRFKSSHDPPLEPARPHAPATASADSWLTPLLNTVKSWIGAPQPAQPAASQASRFRPTKPRATSNRSRQKPVQQRSAAPTASPFVAFKDPNDAWIWQTMTAKQRGQPLPPHPESSVIREVRLRQEKLLASMQRGGKNNSSATGGSVAGGYQRKKPMGSRENLSNPHSTTSRRPRKRLPTPDFLRHTCSPSPSPEPNLKRAQQSLYDFVIQTLPAPTRSLSSTASGTPINSSTTLGMSDSDSSRSPSLPHAASSRAPAFPPTITLSSSPAPPPPASTLQTTFFSSPWLPQSVSIIRRKQHRLALQSRDLSTLESLRSMPSTPLEDEVDEDKSVNFRVYNEGIRNLVEQEDKDAQRQSESLTPRPYAEPERLTLGHSTESRPPAPHRSTSSLLGPSTSTYASVLSSSIGGKGKESSTPSRRFRTKIDRTLDNFHKTSTESPAKRLLNPKTPGTPTELFAEFERLRVEQELEERRALAAELALDQADVAEVPQRKRKWPKKVPREIQDRVATILKQGGYDKTIPGASVDAKAIRRLRPNTWLDDSIIAFYGVLINNRMLAAEKTGQWGEREMKLRKVWCFNSFFWGMYEDNGYKRVKKWTKKFDVFEKDIIIFPMNIRNSHWTCAAVNIKLKRFEYYDSLGNRMQKAHTLLRKWLQEEHEAKKGSPLDLSDWEDYWDPNVPQQDNCNDCGVFTCAFMESLSREVDGFDFDQNQMPYLRQKIAFEIDKGELVPEPEFE
ncbi:hypothetical protein JCM11491_003374 [Sporobolomyces phaffii]